MSWNYRVLRTTDPDGTPVFAIHEVHYREDGAVTGWTERAAWPSGESFSELARDVANYQRAFQEPVIEVRPDGLYAIGVMGHSQTPTRVPQVEPDPPASPREEPPT